MTAGEPPKNKIAAALRRSPLVGADLNLTRSYRMESIFESRRIWWMVIPVITVCAVIAVAAFNIAYFMDGFGACKTVVRNSMPSPDGTKSIVIFGKECGATVGFNTQASISTTGSSFSPEKSDAFLLFPGSTSSRRSGLETAPLNFLLFRRKRGSSKANSALMTSGSRTNSPYRVIPLLRGGPYRSTFVFELPQTGP